MLKPVNQNLDTVTLSDIENHKQLTRKQLNKDLSNLRSCQADTNSNNFYGNPTLYHFQFKNLLKCQREKGKTLYTVWADPEQKEKLLDQTRLRNRGGRTAAGNIFECFRINTGSIVMFKSTTAKYLYKKYNATSVLDPTAGWGGRLLGAWALDIDYVGIDTNTELKPAYDDMIEYTTNYNSSDFFEFNTGTQRMIWDNCLSVDFSKINYDFVLTSPPYINMELYEHMTPWASKAAFYTDFFMPLWRKCIAHCQPGGHVAFNISPKMFAEAADYGLPQPDITEDLLQQLGQQTNTKKQDKTYIWTVS